jgi:hypothetical protein
MSGDSPFEMPTLACRDCGRTDDHTYCIRWLERLHLWLQRVSGTPSEDTGCPRCKGSGIVASVDGEAMDCDCGAPSEDT